MPLVVPHSGQANMPIPIDRGPKPSEVDLMMALATMKDLGRIPSFSERFAGEPPGLPLDAGMAGPAVRGIGKEELRNLKQEWINKGTADRGRAMDLPGTLDRNQTLDSR